MISLLHYDLICTNLRQFFPDLPLLTPIVLAYLYQSKTNLYQTSSIHTGLYLIIPNALFILTNPYSQTNLSCLPPNHSTCSSLEPLCARLHLIIFLKCTNQSVTVITHSNQVLPNHYQSIRHLCQSIPIPPISTHLFTLILTQSDPFHSTQPFPSTHQSSF